VITPRVNMSTPYQNEEEKKKEYERKEIKRN
jgi:hypothetical protein